MTREIRLRLLGPFDARAGDGRGLELKGKKIQGLLAYLGVEAGSPHSREELATLLWGETGQERARHNLRQAISRIRGIDKNLLELEDDRLALAPHCVVDVREFERLVDSDQVAEIERAVDLYRNDLLTGAAYREEAFGDWLWDARARLRDRACAAFERLAGVLTELGRTDEAAEMWRRRLTFDPASETAHRSLMRLYADGGRRSLALRQYQRCVDALERELGVRPGPETEALRDSIRSPATSGVPAGPAPASTQPPSPAASARRGGPGAEDSRLAEPPSVAVLAFESLSEDRGRYFADGIAEDIITSLSSFGSLLVVSRESSFAFRDQGHGITEIGRQLQVQFVVRGSVRVAGSRMRLNVQLIDAASGRHLWAQSYDRQLAELFTVQDEVIETVVATLAGRVEAVRLARARRKPPDQLDAYDFVLRGKELYHRLTAEDCEQSIRMFEEAIERDSGLAMAHAWLGCGLGQAMSFRPQNRDDLLARAEAAALRARELDESEPECHRILFHVAVLRGDVSRARSHIERAVGLNPNDDRILCAMGSLCTLEGRPAEAEQWVRKAMRLNPFHAEGVWFHLGQALFHADRDDEALAALSRITAPKTRELAYRLAVLGRSGHRDAARATATELQALEPGFDPGRWAETLPFVRTADRDALTDALQAAVD